LASSAKLSSRFIDCRRFFLGGEGPLFIQGNERTGPFFLPVHGTVVLMFCLKGFKFNFPGILLSQDEVRNVKVVVVEALLPLA